MGLPTDQKAGGSNPSRRAEHLCWSGGTDKTRSVEAVEVNRYKIKPGANLLSANLQLANLHGSNANEGTV